MTEIQETGANRVNDVEGGLPELRAERDLLSGRAVTGYRVGILCLDTKHPLVLGNVQNASTFAFPVLYETVKRVSADVLMSGGEEALQPILAAARRLERSGVDVIVGACGSFANYQRPVTREVQVPVFMSVLTQVPFLLAGLPASRKLGIVFGSKSSFTGKVMRQCGITDADRIVSISADCAEAFKPILAQQTALDSPTLARQMVCLAMDTLRLHPEIGAWVLQCSDLPPYAADIQHATGLPVFDTCTLIEHVYRASARSEYKWEW